jgi:T5SS/PEP-CTERM-associated repeat protein
VGGGGASEGASTATITGAGSTWITRGDFALGDAGAARLVIEAGGKLESGHHGGQTRIVGGGAQEGELPAAAVVTGPGSSWNILRDFYVGRGTLDILNGGQVTSGGGGETGFDGPGEVTISGPDSTWEIQGRYSMARSGPVTTRIANGGLLSVTGIIESHQGGVLVLDGGRVEAQSISSDVEIRGSGTIQSDITSDGPTIIGSSAGLLTIAGDFTQTPTASLIMELAGRGGVAGVEFDRLVVQGDAILAGFIDVSLIDDFEPRLGDSFELIRYGSMQFANPGAQPELRLPALAPELAWHSSFGPQALTISVQAIPEPASFAIALAGLVVLFRLRRFGVRLRS